MKNKLTFFLMLVCLKMQAQQNYWNRQYGNLSSMLAGAVVGSNIENASIYYNPGTLGFADSIKVTVSSGLYEFTAQRFTNGVNSGQNLIATDVKRFPLSIFPTFKLKNNTTLGFIYVPRLYSNTIVNDVQQNRVDVLQNNKPVPFYTSFDISNYESEWWYGVSFSKKLDKRSGIGITGFVSYRNQNFRYQYAADAWVDTINNTYMNTLMQRQIKYYCYKTIFKIGYFNKHDKYAWGCAATIPAFAVYSNGKTSTRFWFNNFIEADSTSEQTFIAEQQINLKADFKYPITISAGGQLVKGKCTYYLTAESFFEIAPYDVLEINNRIIEINGVTINANKIAGAQTASKFITNVAVAMQYRYKPKQTIAIGLATDFNSLPENFFAEGSNVNSSNWNLYHLTLGFDVDIKKVKVSVGLKCSYGASKNNLQFVDISTAHAGNLLYGNRKYISNYNNIHGGIILGLNF